MGRPAKDQTEVILRAAQEVFHAQGPRAMTIEAVATRAGVGKGTVFLYWPSKDRLLVAVGALEAARLVAATTEALRREPEAFSLGNLVARQVELVWDSPYLAAFLGDPVSVISPEEHLAAARPVTPDGLPLIIEAARRHGLLRDGDREQVVHAVGMLMLGAIMAGSACPDDRAALLASVSATLAAAYETPDAPPEAVRAACADVARLLDEHVDALVALAMPDRPTSADLHP